MSIRGRGPQRPFVPIRAPKYAPLRSREPYPAAETSQWTVAHAPLFPDQDWTFPALTGTTSLIPFFSCAGRSVATLDVQHLDAVPASVLTLLARFGTPQSAKSRQRTKLVEAGGVEPPSGKARNEETTCVARFFLFGQRIRTSKSSAIPSPIDLESRLRTEACSLSR